MLIHTPRLRLITCEEKHLAAIVRDPLSLGDVLRVSIPGQWPAHPSAYPHALSLLKKQPLLPYSGWWFYLILNPAMKVLVGCGGFKGAPDADGVVEIGCEIAPAFRRKGYATEAMRGLVGYAFTRPEVRAVDAYSMPVKCAQSELIREVGMTRIAEATDKVAGKVWHWRITRDAFRASALGARV